VATLTALEQRDQAFCETARVVVTCEMSGLQELADLRAARSKPVVADQRLKEEILKCSGQIERPTFLALASSLLSEAQEVIWKQHAGSADAEMITRLTHLVELVLLRTTRIGHTQRALGIARGLQTMLASVQTNTDKTVRNPLSQKILALRDVLFSSRRCVCPPSAILLERIL
jgi:hypothetical protein